MHFVGIETSILFYKVSIFNTFFPLHFVGIERCRLFDNIFIFNMYAMLYVSRPFQGIPTTMFLVDADSTLWELKEQKFSWKK